MIAHRGTIMANASLQLALQWMFGRTFRLVLGVIALVCGVLYIVQVSAISATGYDIASFEREIQELKRENQRLSFEIAKYQSMTSIEERIADLQLVSIDSIDYVRGADAIVARR